MGFSLGATLRLQRPERYSFLQRPVTSSPVPALTSPTEVDFELKGSAPVAYMRRA
jgi:hypothetical protein